MYRNVIITEDRTLHLTYRVEVLDALSSAPTTFVLTDDMVMSLEGDKNHPEPVYYRTMAAPSRRHGGRQLRLYSCSTEEAKLSQAAFRRLVSDTSPKFVIIRSGSARLAYSASYGLHTPFQYGLHALRDTLEALAASIGLSPSAITMVDDFSELGEVRMGVVEKPDGDVLIYTTVHDIPVGCFWTTGNGERGGLLHSITPKAPGTWLMRLVCVGEPSSDAMTRIAYRLHLHSRIATLSGDEADRAVREVTAGIAERLNIDVTRVLEMRDRLNAHATVCGSDLVWRSPEENQRLRRLLDREPDYSDFYSLSAGRVEELRVAFISKIHEITNDRAVCKQESRDTWSIEDRTSSTRIASFVVCEKGLRVRFNQERVGHRYYLVTKQQDTRLTALRIWKSLR